ncbi:hypothetical protein N9D56_01105 [Methylophilaceae bacterium]|nr:hypothetical protein [Methylophilaceae bacterium]
MADNYDDIENDPDYIRAKYEAEKKHWSYPFRIAIEEIQVQISYGIPALKLIGWIIIALLLAIVYKLYS